MFTEIRMSLDTKSLPPSLPAGSHLPVASRVWSWFTVGAMVSLVLVPLIWISGREEVAKWHLAAAQNAVFDEEYDAALASIGRGLAWNPESVPLLEERAGIYKLQKDYSASLKEYDRLLQLAATEETEMQMRANRADVLLRMRKFGELIDEWNLIVTYRERQHERQDSAFSRYAHAMALNNRAYMRALGRIDLAEALENSERSAEVRGTDDDPSILDTLGYLLLLNGFHADAVAHLEKAVVTAQEQDRVLRAQIHDHMELVSDHGWHERQLKLLDQQMAIIIHHRGEAYLATGEDEKAAADMRKAEELGYDPTEGVW